MSRHLPTSHSFYSQRYDCSLLSGATQGTNHVFVHGVRDHSRTWDDVLEYFADDYLLRRICAAMVILNGCRVRV